MALTTFQHQALTKLRSSGASDLGVGLDNSRLNYLLALISLDLHCPQEFPELDPHSVPGLYERVASQRLRVDGPKFQPLYERLLALEPNGDNYLYCLGSLLKARLKYEKILKAQPMPTLEQVGPRSLLQFGHLESRALAAFLFWRKWIYDIDNRAGQETGYLFEPIVAQAIGGVPYGARNSPVRRDGTGKGRQVDCIRDEGDERRAYELKLRVTIAASGQGRWQEELSFPEDCQKSGFVPVLVVFDDTENDKLTELRKRFENAGGKAYVGTEAWTHLDEQAGPVMSRFLDNYVRAPLNTLLEAEPEHLPRITFALREGKLVVEVAGDTLEVVRENETDPDLSDAAGEQADLLPDDVDQQTPGP